MSSARRTRGWAAALRFVCILAAGACTPLEPPPDPTPRIDEMRAELTTLQDAISDSELELARLQLEQQDLITVLNSQVRTMSGMSTTLDSLPERLKGMCPPPEKITERCDSENIQRVVMAGDRMVVGELEQVWIDPPGVTLHARVDTGATSNSLHADELVEYERDGDRWVRFYVVTSDGEERIEIERKVLRYVRVFQQADPEGSRRPIISMRLRLGDVQDTFEFTLADRSHLNYQLLLGRNFLTDVALVDVGRQFVQPPYKPKRPKKTAKK
jgi:hypothetical protein